MKKLLLPLAAMLSLAATMFAQGTPQYELFVGGSYLRVHAGGTELTQLISVPAIQYQAHNMNFNQYGWDTTLVENVNHWLRGEVDISGFYGSQGAGFLFPASQLVSPSPNFLKLVPIITRYQLPTFGPRFSLRRGRVVYFAHLPVGVAHVNTSLGEPAVVASNFSNLAVGMLRAGTGVAMSPGVVRVNRTLTVRPIQMDYVLTHVFGARQDNVRLSAGLNFTFGRSSALSNRISAYETYQCAGGSVSGNSDPRRCAFRPPEGQHQQPRNVCPGRPYSFAGIRAGPLRGTRLVAAIAACASFQDERVAYR